MPLSIQFLAWGMTSFALIVGGILVSSNLLVPLFLLRTGFPWPVRVGSTVLGLAMTLFLTISGGFLFLMGLGLILGTESSRFRYSPIPYWILSLLIATPGLALLRTGKLARICLGSSLLLPLVFTVYLWLAFGSR